jgi:hypothetical protein
MGQDYWGRRSTVGEKTPSTPELTALWWLRLHSLLRNHDPWDVHSNCWTSDFQNQNKIHFLLEFKWEK